jgi:non-ribosomal peptide synthetase component F
MLSHFGNLLEAVTDNPETRLSALVLLSTSEHKQLLVEWNNTEVDHTNNRCVQQLFEIQVDRTPEAVAVISANERITYGELNRRSNQLADHLRTLGVGPRSQLESV